MYALKKTNPSINENVKRDKHFILTFFKTCFTYEFMIVFKVSTKEVIIVILSDLS